MNTLSVLVGEETRPAAGTLGPTRGGAGQTVEDISTEKLRTSLTGLSEQISRILQDIKRVGDFNLKTVQIEVAISAEGRFILVGKAGVKGAVRLTFSGN